MFRRCEEFLIRGLSLTAFLFVFLHPDCVHKRLGLCLIPFPVVLFIVWMSFTFQQLLLSSPSSFASLFQSPEGSDEGWSPGQRSASSRGQERQPRLALLREAHQEPPHPHRGAPPQTINSTVLCKASPQRLLGLVVNVPEGKSFQTPVVLLGGTLQQCPQQIPNYSVLVNLANIGHEVTSVLVFKTFHVQKLDSLIKQGGRICSKGSVEAT